jgi:hypothetical protein
MSVCCRHHAVRAPTGRSLGKSALRPEPRGYFPPMLCSSGARPGPLTPPCDASVAHTRSSTDALPPWRFLEARVSRYLTVAFNSSRDARAPSNDRVQGTRFRSFWPRAARAPKNSSARTSVSPAFSCSRDGSTFESRVLLRLDHNLFQYGAWRVVDYSYFIDNAMRLTQVELSKIPQLVQVFLLHVRVIMMFAHAPKHQRAELLQLERRQTSEAIARKVNRGDSTPTHISGIQRE